jgi:hypothetical protein
MKKLTTLLSVIALLTMPLPSFGAVIFSDSFESDNTSYGNPNGDSTPPYNDPVGGGTDTTALTGINTDAITGKDGTQYLTIFTAGGAANTDTITTKSSDIGTFTANTTYTLSVLMQNVFGGDGAPGDLFTGTLSLLDASTSSSTLNFVSHNFATGDANFDIYSLTFDTGLHPTVVGDTIQIGLSALVDTDTFQGINFDKIVLSSAADAVLPTTPEPATLMLLGLGIMSLIFVGRRAGQKQIS